MQSRFGTACLLGLILAGAAPLAAQQPTDSLRQAMARLSARLDTLEQGGCPAGPAVTLPAARDSVTRGLSDLAARLERVIAARCGAGAAAAKPDTTAAGDDLAALRAAAAAAAGAAPSPQADTTTKAVEKVEFVGRQRSGSALNPEISATGDLRLAARKDHGLSGDAHEFEVAFQSTLDPYSNAKIIATLSNEEVGIEEGYIWYTGLPARIRADLGLIRQQVGDLNRWHLHALPETEYPLVYQRYLGEDGLSGAGLSLYTTLPVSIAHGTHEIWAQGTTASSDPLYGTGRHGTLLGRIQNFWQLSRSTYGQIGFTALGGDHGDTLQGRVLGADLRLTWRPPNEGTRKNLTLRVEGYRFRGKELSAVTTRYGMFAGLVAQVSPRWILGTRYDWVESPRGARETEWQITPTITWWESEFVYLRLEGRHHRLAGGGTDNQLVFQTVFAMGPHKHETY
ncbi:MAG TPA: hypothetical protein VG692_18945 [Gemmatimonadales bacterium]|nr:hypothetical protein [Gemmatimonadales bacterium]